MRVSQLRLSGFKSFVEPAELFVEDGLTGIVGPNGCGKSNILEALCWLMGEASFQKMRAKSMEEVIFSGTSVRPAYNHAEATLVIDNHDHSARAPYSDVDIIEVTRRIERDSGSSYSINGNPVLAREARVLFADMIGGAHSPFLVHQGRIANLISSSPAERRALLDQAAGIGGLRARRHEAEQQLKAASANLERLKDTIRELQDQFEALNRQARQARRYRTLAQRIRATEALVLYTRWQDARKEETVLRESILQVDESLEVASREAAQRSKDLQQADEALNSLRENEAHSAAGLNRIRIEQERLDTRGRLLREKRESLDTSLKQSENDLEHEAARLRDFEATRGRLKEEKARLHVERPEAALLLQEAGKRTEQAQQNVAGLERVLEELLSEVAKRRSRLTEAERDATRLRERATLLTDRIEALQQERRRLQETEDRMDAPAAEQPDREQQLEALRERENEAERALQTARQEESQAGDAYREGERERQRIRAEMATLRELLGETKNGKKLEFPGVIREIAVEPEYEVALGASLGNDLDASLDVNAPVSWKRMETSVAAAGLPDGVRPLKDRMRAPEALEQRLLQIGVVAREQGATLQKKLLPGQSLVSIEGDVWRWDGYCAMAAAMEGATVEKLARRNRLRELEQCLAGKEEELPSLQQRLLDARENARSAAAAVSAARLERRQSETSFFEERKLALRRRQESQERIAHLKAMAETTGRLQEELAEIVRQETGARAELGTLANDEDPEPKAMEMRGKLQSAREELAVELAQGQALERDNARQDQREKEIAAELATWERRIGAIGEQMESLRQRRQQSREELAALKSEPEEIARLHEALLQQLSKAEANHTEALDALAVGESKLNDCAELEAAARENAGAMREERARRGGMLEGARQRLGEATAQIRRELECAPEQIPEAIADDAGGRTVTDESPEHLEGRLRRLLAERDRLGGVNLRAEEDARDIGERLGKLTDQQEELLGAVSRLREAINSLNREGRRRLGDAFTLVDKNFTELFGRLFNGGTAHLRFLGEATEEDEAAHAGEDLLEAGLEILARPPGKRLQSLSLLSGGEQSMTALALIFAVFLVKAPPICMLDEADAPLDDINVDRFCRLIRDVCEMSGARILLITHHPLTMARMDRLYGVTMQERGVSRLVSVDLEQDGGVRESAVAAAE